MSGKKKGSGLVDCEHGKLKIMSSAATISIESQILAGVIAPTEPPRSEAAARAMLAISFSETDRQRMRELAEKARNGELTAEDREWLDGYEKIGSLIGLLQSKARISLRKITTGQS